MLSGIILQPGAWDVTRGDLDDVLIANNVMQNVASPVTLWSKPGNVIGRVTISGLDATGVYRSAFSAESWADTPIKELVLRGVRAEFAGGGQPWPAEKAVEPPGFDARLLPAWGLYARNITTLTLEDTRFSLATNDLRPVLQVEQASRLNLDGFNFTHVPGVAQPLRLTNVTSVSRRPAE